MAQAIQDNPEIGAVLQGYQQGDYDGLLNSQAALQALADSTGVSVDVIITRITQELRAKGATDGQLVAIDQDASNRKDVIKTTAHELDHVRGGSSETLANLAGIAADLNVSASMDANQDEIDSYKPALGNGKDAITQAENKQLLDKNDITLITAVENDPESFDYDATYRCTGPGWTNCGNAQDRALINEAKRLFPNSTADQEAYKAGKRSAFGSSVVNAGKGLAEIARDPKSAITNSFRGMINVLTDPNKAGQDMRAAIIQWKSDYNNAIKNNPRLAGQMRGELEDAVGFGVATTVIGGTSANALKALQQTGKLKAVERKRIDAETKAQIIENNQNADLPNVLGGNPNSKSDAWVAQKKKTDIANGTYNPHYDTKHGPYTTLQQQYDRAMKGINPETGTTGKKPVFANASRFFNSADMKTAIEKAERLYAANPKDYPDRLVDITFNKSVGEGYMGKNTTNATNGVPAGQYRWSNVATVGIDKTGKSYTAYPNLNEGHIKK